MYDTLVGAKLHDAGLDVFEIEPADQNDPLFRLASSILVADIARHAFTNMQSVLRGMPLPPDDLIVAAGENR